MARRLNFAPREIKRQDNRESPGESCDNMNNTQVKEISAGAPLDAGPVEVLRIPFLSTGNRTIDKAFSIACGDLAGNIGLYRAGLLESKVPVIRAGLQYPTPWTRDASFNSWYAGAVIAPEIARNTLLAALARRDGELRIDEEYGQYWDTIIWAWGAWNYWLCSGDTEFLLTALPATENTLRFFRRTEFDPEDGLFRGGACFQDGISAYPDRFVSDDCGSGILDCLHDCPKHDWLVKVGCGIPCKALSTNCLYLLACQSAANMRRVLHLPVPPELERETAALKQAIDRSFWREDAGCFRYLIDAGDTVERQEGLGIAFAILAGVVSAPRLSRLIANTHLTPNGIAAVWPQYERYASAPGVYARHSGTIWPQVNAAWCQALAESGFREQALRETELLAAKAVRDSMFYEIYHPGKRPGERHRGMAVLFPPELVGNRFPPHGVRLDLGNAVEAGRSAGFTDTAGKRRNDIAKSPLPGNTAEPQSDPRRHPRNAGQRRSGGKDHAGSRHHARNRHSHAMMERIFRAPPSSAPFRSGTDDFFSGKRQRTVHDREFLSSRLKYSNIMIL